MRSAVLALTSILLVPAFAAAEDVSAAALKRAAQKALSLLEATSPTFIQKGGCNSCHNQKLAAAAQALARQRGIPTGAAIAQLADDLSEATTERFVEYAQGGGAGVSGLGYELFARAAAGEPADERTHAQIYYLKSMQRADGSWRAGGNRPPITFDDFTSTAFIVRAMTVFAPPLHEADTRQRVDRARQWLLEARAETTQEKAFQLLGLAWSSAEHAAMRRSLTALQGLQRKDGGWSQLASMPSDAYATGLALYALAQAGLPVKDVGYQRGLRYLLDTQAADGTWHVKTRSLPFQPYFETGYPYHHDQWISAAGAAYAAMAIASAVDMPRHATR